MLSKAEQRLRKGEYVLLLFQATVRVQQGALTGAKPTAAVDATGMEMRPRVRVPPPRTHT